MNSSHHCHLFALFRQRPRTIGLAAVSLVGASAASVSAYYERDADVEVLPLLYDPQVIAAHWKARPWATLRRRFELTRIFLPFSVKTYVEWRRGNLAEPAAQAACAAKLRGKLQEAGPTFIKVGQALSSRPDLLPPPALRELQRLCDQCPIVDWRHAYEILLEGLAGSPPEDIFGGAGSEALPISAASLGQVYQWEYRGRKVAVKVQRPDLRRHISLDLYLIRVLATIFRAGIRRFTKQRTDHVMLADAWAAGTWSELDYMAEAENQDKFRNAMARLMPGRVKIPEVMWEVSSSKVLVSEWIDGPKLGACSPQIQQELIPTGIECFSLQLMELGFFHSDPHPGNILVQDGQLVLIDFGLVAHLERPDMNHLALATVHLIRGDHERLFDDIVALGFLPSDTDRDAILSVLSPVLNLTIAAGSDMKNRMNTFQSVSDNLNKIFYDFPFEVPPYFALITRAILTLEGIALQGDDQFDIFQAAYPFAFKLAKDLLLKGDPVASAGMAASAMAIASMNSAVKADVPLAS